MSSKKLGVLGLENKLPAKPGTLRIEHCVPVERLNVPGAWTPRVVDGDPSLTQEYVRCAKELEEAGVAAITSSCGFGIAFQAEVSAAVSIPVALSSLSLVPLMANLLPEGSAVGILTYDSTKLREEHFAAAGWSTNDIDVAIAGIEGSESWQKMLEPVVDLLQTTVVDDVLVAVKSLLQKHPSVGALVLECTAFPVAAEAVRAATGLAVVDWTSLTRLLVDASPLPA